MVELMPFAAAVSYHISCCISYLSLISKEPRLFHIFLVTENVLVWNCSLVL